MRKPLSYIPGIRDIRLILCKDIPDNIDLAAEANVLVPISLNSTAELLYIGQPDLSVEESNEAINTNGTATLTFSGASDIFPHQKIGLIIQSVSGEWFLLGSHDSPISINSKSSLGTTSTPKVTTYTVTYSSLYTLVKIATYS